MPDLTAGSTVRAQDTPPTVSDRSDTSILGFSNTGYSAGSPAVGKAFTAPTTGRVIVYYRAFLDNSSTTGQTYLSFRVGDGAAVGGGGLFLAADDSRALIQTGQSQLVHSSFELVTGLTPGATYNVQLQHRVSGAVTGDTTWRHVIVAPAT